MSETELYKSIFEIEDNSDEYEIMDLKVINFIKMANNKCHEKMPEPTYFTISTQSAMCKFSNIFGLDLSKLIRYISEKVFVNIVLKNDEDYPIKGIVIDNLIIRYDDSYLKKYKKPFVSYLGKNVDTSNIEELRNIVDNLFTVDNESLKKQGRTSNKKDCENFYNSCSIIVKAGINEKCVNIKLFNNGKITLTGSKKELDGYNGCCILLNEIKKERECFLNYEELNFDDIKVEGYSITMINSDFNTNFKIDLISLLNILNEKNEYLFTKFNPEKYRGLIIGFYWNMKSTNQNGVCSCKTKCTGKGTGNGEGQCKKITISIFKSGSVIITGGKLVEQIEDAYAFINNVFKDNYGEIVKMSILDFINEEDENNDEDIDYEHEEVEKKKSKKVKDKENEKLKEKVRAIELENETKKEKEKEEKIRASEVDNKPKMPSSPTIIKKIIKVTKPLVK